MKISLEVNFNVEKITDFEKLAELLSALQDAASVVDENITLTVSDVPEDMDFSS